MASPAELAVHVSITKAYIDTRPVVLSFVPHVRLPDGTGGKKLTPAPPRDPQTVRFIETSTQAAAEQRSTDTASSQFTQEAHLLALPSATFEVNDTFEWDGSTWTVVEITFPNEWSRRAVVRRYSRGAP